MNMSPNRLILTPAHYHRRSVQALNAPILEIHTDLSHLDCTIDQHHVLQRQSAERSGLLGEGSQATGQFFNMKVRDHFFTQQKSLFYGLNTLYSIAKMNKVLYFIKAKGGSVFSLKSY